MKRMPSSAMIATLAVVTFVAAAAANPSRDMRYGPHQMMSLRARWPSGNIAYKGAVIRLSEGAGDAAAYACFDTELLRWSAGWVGGFIDFKGVSYDGSHGGNPGPGGQQLWATLAMPGVGAGDALYDDARPHKPHGPLPRKLGRYRGLYHHGDRVVVSYTIGDTGVLELPGYYKAGDVHVFTRTIKLDKSTKPIHILIDDAKTGGGDVVAASANLPAGGKIVTLNNTRAMVTIPAGTTPALFTVGVFTGAAEDQLYKATDTLGTFKQTDPTTLTKGGPRTWTEAVSTQGVLAPANNPKNRFPYVVDTLTIPYDNPYKSWMRTGDFDFYTGGARAAITTWNGDVWIVDGIDDDLDELKWTRYAAGIFDGLGLKIVDDVVYVTGRDGITRLHDLNKDGQADFYECFNNDVLVTHGFHEFTYALHTDAEGNFYFCKGGAVRGGGSGWEIVVPHHGCVFKVSPNGEKFEVIATGMRAPNGMGVGPDGQITTGDNEGTWVPQCRINYWTKQELAKRKGFGGVVDLAHREPKPDTYDPPICWLPKNIDNSGGGQVWVASNKWGPFTGDLLHLSYGQSSLYKVMFETVDGVPQGGVVRFPLSFQSGVMRGRFNPRDGQLYVLGLRGWQTNGALDGAFQRVRYTGRPVHMPTAIRATKSGIAITFTCTLDKELAEDLGSYAVEQWNYRWTSIYGSDHYKVSKPDEKGADKVEIQSAKLLKDGKTVFLTIKDIQPVMQMKINVNVESAEGEAIKHEIYSTVNLLGPDEKLAAN